MHAIADLCVVPLGVGLSLSPYIAACQEVLEAHGLTRRLHAYGTNVEGDLDTVLAAIAACHRKLHEMGAPRLSTSIKLGTRTDREQTLEGKIRSVTSARAGGPDS